MASFGEELRRERELREISLREVSESTKISVRHLEALESNDFASLPEGTVFRKGYVRAYCEHIGIDPDSMLNAYLLEERERDEHGGAADVDVMRGRGVRAGRDGEPLPNGTDGRLVWLVIAAVVLVVAVGLAWWAWGALRGESAPDDASSLALSQSGVHRG